jgi:predicted amidophosphoribosyltransferase
VTTLATIARAVEDALFPRAPVDRLLERVPPEALRAAIRAPLPDPALPVRALFAYDDPLARRLVLLIKESRSRGAAAGVGALLADEILAWLGAREATGRRAGALVVPVPLSPAARRTRGYSQTELLCEGIIAALAPSTAAYAPRALRKIRETPKQALLARAARLENVRGAFLADPNLVRGRAVALVDDVATTGATLRACRLALRRAGASDVSLFAAVRA